MDETFERVSEAILSTPGAFRSISSNPAILVCREISPYYIDNRVIYSFPVKRDIIAHEMADLVEEVDKERTIHKLTTTETAGIPICSFVGYKLGIGTTYVKKKAKAHGLGKRIEGIIKEGEYVVGVDDLATKGTTAKIAIDTVRNLNAEIDKYFVIFDRRQGATELLAKLNVKLYSLAQMCPEFIDIALKKGVITEKEYKLFEEYSKNPTEWSKNYILKNPEFLKAKLSSVVENGKLKDMTPLEVLTKGHPELKSEFEPKVRDWLAELKVEQEVPEFNYP